MSLLRPLCVAAALALVLSGCETHQTGTTPQVAAHPTPINQLNVATFAIPRIDFCQLLPKRAVNAAVLSQDWKVAAYGNGDKAPITSTTSDVAAEHRCVWTESSGQVTAEAWVFARPVDQELAQAVVREEKRPGCRTSPRPRFGNPSVNQECRIDGGTRVRHEGLVGDTWLGCEVSGPAGQMDATRRRAGAWCVEVANALNTAS